MSLNFIRTILRWTPCATRALSLYRGVNGKTACARIAEGGGAARHRPFEGRVWHRARVRSICRCLRASPRSAPAVQPPLSPLTNFILGRTIVRRSRCETGYDVYTGICSSFFIFTFFFVYLFNTFWLFVILSLIFFVYCYCLCKFV